MTRRFKNKPEQTSPSSSLVAAKLDAHSKKKVDISFVLNAHNEGHILMAAINSAILAAEDCHLNGINTEIILICDSGDDITREIVECQTKQISKHAFVNYKNLGLSRNHGLSLATGDFVCFLDGDDIWQLSWPRRAYNFAKDTDFKNTIFHTEIFAAFNDVRFLRKQIQTVDKIFHPLNLLSTWHYCNNLFAHKSLFTRFPIEPYNHEEGYGSEDWHWSCETIADGCNRLYVPETVYFYRINSTKTSLGSVKNLVLRPTKLFSSSYLTSSYSDYTELNFDASLNDIEIADKLQHESSIPIWLVEEVLSTTKIDPDVYSLYNDLAYLKVSTPALFISTTLVLSEYMKFVANNNYALIGIDCETVDDKLLSLLVHGMHASASATFKLVVLCGSKLTNNKLMRKGKNIIYINTKLILESKLKDNYALNCIISAALSNAQPRAIININSEYLEFFTGDYQKFIKAKQIRTVKIFTTPIEDICNVYERLYLSKLIQKDTYNREIWVRDNSSSIFASELFKCSPLSINTYDIGYLDEELNKILNYEPITSDTPLIHIPIPNKGLSNSRSTPTPSISCILNAHREQGLIVPTLKSVSRMINACVKRSILVELIIILDKADNETRDIVRNSIENIIIGHYTRVIEVENGDLGASRRDGIKHSRGNYIALLDADDLYSENWLIKALTSASRAKQAKNIYHPELNIYFGSQQRFFWHPDTKLASTNAPGLLLDNFWTSLSFADRDVYQKIPILDINPHSGFGFEDWHWNMETYAQGYNHCVVPETVHFIRLKSKNSLNRITAERNAIVRPSSLAREILFSNSNFPFSALESSKK